MNKKRNKNFFRKKIMVFLFEFYINFFVKQAPTYKISLQYNEIKFVMLKTLKNGRFLYNERDSIALLEIRQTKNLKLVILNTEKIF